METQLWRKGESGADLRIHKAFIETEKFGTDRCQRSIHRGTKHVPSLEVPPYKERQTD